MDTSHSNKRISVSFIPYRKFEDGSSEFYLQMRDMETQRFPGQFGFFGGGIESGESIESCMRRETYEELRYLPKGANFYKSFEDEENIFNVFLEEVGPDFESEVHVCEGRYGAFIRFPYRGTEVIAEHVLRILSEIVRSSVL